MSEDPNLKQPSDIATCLTTLIVFAVGMAMALGAIVGIIDQKGWPTILSRTGLSLIIFGGCFDPMNFLWNIFAFLPGRIAVSPRRAKIGWIVVGNGAVCVVVGLIVGYCLS
jgi:hypothetical protein